VSTKLWLGGGQIGQKKLPAIVVRSLPHAEFFHREGVVYPTGRAGKRLFDFKQQPRRRAKAVDQRIAERRRHGAVENAVVAGDR
jgi:hypothetical protein